MLHLDEIPVNSPALTQREEDPSMRLDRIMDQLIATGYGLAVDPIAPNKTGNYEVWINMPVDIDMESVDIEIAAKGDLP